MNTFFWAMVVTSFDSAKYWETRYSKGGRSGAGSYGRHAAYKAKFLNEFTKHHNVTSIAEFGVGDGNQLSLAIYPAYVDYLGIDVSHTTISNLQTRFTNDRRKAFVTLEEWKLSEMIRHQTYNLCMSLDVIYHLVEDNIFEN